VEDVVLRVLNRGEFLETRHLGRLQVRPSDMSRVSMWSQSLRLYVAQDHADSMFPLKVTAPDILVTVRARAVN
jgi:hypothetical protein